MATSRAATTPARAATAKTVAQCTKELADDDEQLAASTALVVYNVSSQMEDITANIGLLPSFPMCEPKKPRPDLMQACQVEQDLETRSSMICRGCVSDAKKTVAQRTKELANDDEQLAAWKSGLRWAKERAADHVVHIIIEGRERDKKLFEDFDASKAKTYDDQKLREMLDWFVLAQEQYKAFL